MEQRGIEDDNLGNQTIPMPYRQNFHPPNLTVIYLLEHSDETTNKANLTHLPPSQVDRVKMNAINMTSQIVSLESNLNYPRFHFSLLRLLSFRKHHKSWLRKTSIPFLFIEATCLNSDHYQSSTLYAS